MVKDDEHVLRSIIIFYPPKHTCILWSLYQGTIPNSERCVSMKGRIHPNMVMKLHCNSVILTGRFLLGKMELRTANLVNGPVFVKAAADSAMEFLIVSDICRVSWVPHIAINLVPTRAVMDGWRANGKLLFVASLWTTDSNMTNKYYCGFFDPKSQLAYMWSSEFQPAYHGGKLKLKPCVGNVNAGHIFQVLMY